MFPTGTGRRLTRDAFERRVATHAATAQQCCPSLAGKRVHPHVLRHSCAMSLLQARVDSTVIALWLGHADTSSTQQYIHADMTIEERALALLSPPAVEPGRYTPSDNILAYLDSLGWLCRPENRMPARGAHRRQTRPPSAEVSAA